MINIIPQIFFNKSLVRNSSIKKFIAHFSRNDNWHELDIDKGNLGYGWIHYSLIRVLKPKRVLCVGSRFGYIPAICALACKDNQKGKVDFVDASYSQDSFTDKDRHWGGVGFWKGSDPQKHFARFGLSGYIKVHVTTSREFKKKFSRRKWGYIHLDGDHSYKGVKQDYDRFWSKLEKGGFMAFHDINTNLDNDLNYGVDQFWQEIKKEKASFELPGSNGVGILQK